MSGRGGAANPCIKVTVSMMKVHPMLTLPQAMWMAKFSETECKDRTMQMRVHQAKASQMPGGNTRDIILIGYRGADNANEHSYYGIGCILCHS